MTLAVAAVNLLLGLAYCGYGVMTAVEMRRDWRTFGFSHFGVAWILMAFTCGPHHLFHGIHLAFEGRPGGALDLFAVVTGLPVGVMWLWLRIEAFFGGRGDRYIPGTPRWLRAVPYVSAVYVCCVVAGAMASLHSHLHFDSMVVANLLLLVIYVAIGWFVLRTQLANRSAMAGWSVSGLSLALIFPTCALMHAVWAIYDLAGKYHSEIHGFIIDWLSIPAGLYFLWVVRSLYRDSLNDWNSGPVAAPSELTPTAVS